MFSERVLPKLAIFRTSTLMCTTEGILPLNLKSFKKWTSYALYILSNLNRFFLTFAFPMVFIKKNLVKSRWCIRAFWTSRNFMSLIGLDVESFRNIMFRIWKSPWFKTLKKESNKFNPIVNINHYITNFYTPVFSWFLLLIHQEKSVT